MLNNPYIAMLGVMVRGIGVAIEKYNEINGEIHV